jgi:hypothetical protein
MTSRGGLALALACVVSISVICPLACGGEFRFDEVPAGDASTPDAEEPDTASAPIACTGDGDCAALGMRCDAPSGRCVACTEDAHCSSGARRRCEKTLHICVECLGTSDCGTRHTCETTTHRCLDTCAEGDEYCPMAGFVCDEGLRRCIECRTNAHCAGSPRGARCDTAIGVCVECAGNAACPTTAPHCDRRTGKCVGCVTSAECPAGSACDPSTLTCRSLAQ